MLCPLVLLNLIKKCIFFFYRIAGMNYKLDRISIHKDQLLNLQTYSAFDQVFDHLNFKTCVLFSVLEY